MLALKKMFVLGPVAVLVLLTLGCEAPDAEAFDATGGPEDRTAVGD